MPISFVESSNITTVLSLLARQNVPSQDVSVWLKVCRRLDDQEFAHLAQALAEPGSAAFLTENMKQKLAAFEQADAKALDSILAQEETHLASLSAQS